PYLSPSAAHCSVLVGCAKSPARRYNAERPQGRFCARGWPLVRQSVRCRGLGVHIPSPPSSFSLLTAAVELSEHTACAKSRGLASHVAKSLTRFCTPYGAAPLLKPERRSLLSPSRVCKIACEALQRGTASRAILRTRSASGAIGAHKSKAEISFSLLTAPVECSERTACAKSRRLSSRVAKFWHAILHTRSASGATIWRCRDIGACRSKPGNSFSLLTAPVECSEHTACAKSRRLSARV